MTAYRRIHRIGPFESVPIALVEAWDAARKAKAAEAPIRPVAPILTTSWVGRGGPVVSLGDALATLGG